MSDSGYTSDKPAVHPCFSAWTKFRVAQPRLFEGTAEGKYLDNRLNEAFSQGWLACERQIRNALEGLS